MTDQSAFKSASLLAIRVGTGLLLVLWGALRLIKPAAGPGLAEKYYSGFMAMETIQIAFGAAEVLVGLFVILGLFRRVVYSLQAVVLVLGGAVLWRYLLDPMGLYLLDSETSQILFFPSITVAAASLVLLAFRDADRWSVDRLLSRRAAVAR